MIEAGLDLRDAAGQEGEPAGGAHLGEEAALGGAHPTARALDLDGQEVAGDELAKDVGAAGEGVAHEAAGGLAVLFLVDDDMGARRATTAMALTA